MNNIVYLLIINILVGCFFGLFYFNIRIEIGDFGV